MIDYEKHFKEVLLTLESEGILNNIIVVGSWCLLLYKYVFSNFEPSIRTTDVDFFVPNPKSIKEKNSVINSLREINYDLVIDCLSNKSIFISHDGFELEFLTRVARDMISTVKLGNTNIYAEALSCTDIFIGNYIVVNYEGLLVKVASPSSYILQKLLVNEQRGEKKQKDIESIKTILLFIESSKKYSKELKDLYSALPNKWKKKIDVTLTNNDIKLFEFKG